MVRAGSRNEKRLRIPDPQGFLKIPYHDDDSFSTRCHGEAGVLFALRQLSDACIAISLQIYFQKWIDDHLTWRPTDFGGIDTIRLPSETVWTPDIVLYNKYESRRSTPMQKFRCRFTFWIMNPIHHPVH